MRIFLAGIGCVGKTTVGAKLADLLDHRFFDLDVEIERLVRFRPNQTLLHLFNCPLPAQNVTGAYVDQFRNLLSQLRPIASFSPFSSLPLLMGADVVADVVELRSGASSVPSC
jgi:hypothetical protein